MDSLTQCSYMNLRNIAAVAGMIALTAGCCGTSTTRTARYERYNRTAYAGGTYESSAPAPQPARTESYATTETTGFGATNMVVPLYQEQVNVGKREVESGSVRLKKIVRTETVNVPVELRHEEVVIDRDNNARAGQTAALGQPFQEGETVIPLRREEAVVEKQTASAGQIVVQTRFAGERTNVQAQVRKEDIDIAKQGNTQNVIISGNVHAQATGAAETPGGQAYGSASANVITDPATIYTSSDPATFADRPVRFEKAKVRRVVGDRLIVLGSDNQNLYVIPEQGASMPTEGDTVIITGKVTKSPGSASELGLSGEAAQTFGSQPIYVDARSIQVVR